MTDKKRYHICYKDFLGRCAHKVDTSKRARELAGSVLGVTDVVIIDTQAMVVELIKGNLEAFTSDPNILDVNYVGWEEGKVVE